MCFVLLIICVVGIANGPVGMVFFYEKEVQDKAVELELTTREMINKRIISLFSLSSFLCPFSLARYSFSVILVPAGESRSTWCRLSLLQSFITSSCRYCRYFFVRWCL